MKFLDMSQNQEVTNHLPLVDHRHKTESRRSILQKMLGSCAAFATGLVVSNRAEATQQTECPCEECYPGANFCAFSTGLCFSAYHGTYVQMLQVWEGIPTPQGCCQDITGGQICQYACLLDPMPC